MILLKNIFGANDSFDPFFVTSYISQLVTTYITEFHSKNCLNKKRYEYLSLLPTDYSLQNNSNDLTSTISEIIAWQEKHEDPSTLNIVNHPEKSFPLEMHQLKKLGKVFFKMNSNDIKNLLKLLDHPKSKIRRLMILLIQILLKSKRAKKRFIDKCGLGIKPGLFMINRLKDLAWDNQNEINVFMLIKQINEFITKIEKKIVKSKIILKGTHIKIFYKYLMK